MTKIKILICMLICASVLAQKDNGEEKRKSKVVTFLNNAKTTIRDPFNLRDPFKRRRVKSSGTSSTGEGKKVPGVFSNLPTIEGVPLSSIRIVGVLLGKNRRAIAKVVGKSRKAGQTFILREGMKIGENKAEVKAIMPGGIVLVEGLVSVYDQNEYLETVIPISSE